MCSHIEFKILHVQELWFYNAYWCTSRKRCAPELTGRHCTTNTTCEARYTRYATYCTTLKMGITPFGMKHTHVLRY